MSAVGLIVNSVFPFFRRSAQGQHDESADTGACCTACPPVLILKTQVKVKIFGINIFSVLDLAFFPFFYSIICRFDLYLVSLISWMFLA